MTANASGDWRADIRAAMDALRDMMLRHHWFPGLFPTRPSIGPNALRFWAGLIDVLTRAGLNGADLDNAFCMVGDYVIGTTAIEVTFGRWLAADPEGVATTRAYVSEAAAAYPSYARYVDDYIVPTDAAVRRDRRSVRFGVHARRAGGTSPKTASPQLADGGAPEPDGEDAFALAPRVCGPLPPLPIRQSSPASMRS